MFTYCLFCESQKCAAIAAQAELVYPCRAIKPQLVQLKWVKKQPINETHDLLPGYVFLYAEEEIPDIGVFRAISGVIRCLSDMEHHYVLQGDDEQFALMLLEKNGVLGKVPVYEEGKMIRIKEGAFAGVQAKILRVDRRGKRLQIELPFTYMLVKTWLEFEIVEDAENENEY
ncbi:MAG: hypothetical protein IJ662_11400 [Clostridia bacterium]|nr:hypothetical protein [Clostridia bacterium]